MYLSVRHVGQLVTPGKIARIAKSILCKIIARKDIISNEQFPTSTVYRQLLIFVDKFCLIFYHQREKGVLKNIFSKILV